MLCCEVLACRVAAHTTDIGVSLQAVMSFKIMDSCFVL